MMSMLLGEWGAGIVYNYSKRRTMAGMQSAQGVLVH